MSIKSSFIDILKNIFAALILVGTFVFLWLNWGNLPDKIPGHYDAAGAVDRWGDKSELIALPIVAVILFIGITVVEQFPKIWNTGVTVTDQNRGRVYSALKSMIITEKLLVVAVFSFLSIYQASAKALPFLFLPCFFLIMLGSLAFYFLKMRKAK